MGVSVSVERLRVWLLAGAVLLVIVIAAFLGYARYRAHRFLTELPGKLGADIRQETNSFTYSQSGGPEGKTLYTIHAAKAIQHKDGRYTLRDVGIVLYGRKQERADRIYGSEFEYDQKAGVVRAMGEVHLDLEAPTAKDAHAKMDYAAGKDLKGKGEHEVDDAHLIHVTTSGLVYLEKLGVAATDQEIEFEAGGVKGQAVGADYSSDTGVVVLHSAVKMVGLEKGQPTVLTATRAELDRAKMRVVLSHAKYVTVGGRGSGDGAAAGEQTAQAELVAVRLRSDGTAEKVEAEGAVTLKDGEGGVVTAPRGVVLLNAASQPQSAVLSGGVKYGADGPLRQSQGEAAESRATFDKVGRLERVLLTGAVHLHERVRGSGAAGWSERELGAGAVDLAMDTNAGGKVRLREATGTGDARLRLVNPPGKTGGATSSSLAGDVLTAHFARVNGAQHLTEVHGDGHTSLRRTSATGVVNTSSGDSLEVKFRPAAGAAAHRAGQSRQKNSNDAGRLGTDEVASAVEQGHVVMMQQPVRKVGETGVPAEERATAERAAYDGDLERMTLTGNVQVSDASSVLWADRVVTEQKTGDATADGSVKVSYVQPKDESAKGAAAKSGSAKGGASEADNEPVHVLAERAELKHDSQVAVFHGASGKPARLWQGASQVEAPMIQFEQKVKRLTAKGNGQGAAMGVRTVLASAAKKDSAKGDGTGAKAKGGAGLDKVNDKASVLRVASRELVYSDETREAKFSGGVRVESADGSMRGQEAVVYLQGASAGGGKAAGGKTVSGAGQSGFMGGGVERVVATGHISIDQPGRRATGEQVVYTADDGVFVLTGTAGLPPKIVDEQRGTVTGTLLRFHARDQSVVVSNGGSNGAGQRVRTETRVKK